MKRPKNSSFNLIYCKFVIVDAPLHVEKDQTRVAQNGKKLFGFSYYKNTANLVVFP